MPTTNDNSRAAATANLVILTVNDDSIATVCRELARAGVLGPGKLVIHMSGVLQLDALEPAAASGALIGCAHPLQSFATREMAVRDLRGSFFGVTAGPGAAEALDALVEVLGGHAVRVRDEDKMLYHAAAVFASNYLVAVEDIAAQLLVEAGFSEPTARQALVPLLRVTSENVAALGATDALTGPIVRGDVDTVRRHLVTLKALGGDPLAVYKLLGRHCLAIARRRATLDAETLDALAKLLG